jgi:O-antigen ligase
MIFSFRAISSISVACLPIAGLIKNKVEQKRFFNPRLKNPLFILCCLFFLLQLISLLYANDMHEAWRNIWLKFALVIIPFSLWSCDFINSTTRQRILKWYCVAIFIACLFALYSAYRNYLAFHKPSVFVYHALVSKFSGHAIQFSILVLIALVYLLEMLKRKEIFFRKFFHLFLILFFLGFLFLLSSKLVIVFSLVYFLLVMARIFMLKAISKTFVVGSVTVLAIVSFVIFLTKNPISNRFDDIWGTDFNLLNKEKFTPAQYFNGVQFRLIQWRFVSQILTDKKAWLTGVSVGDAQTYLNQKYISENMYIGSPERGDKGFIGYNTHNEFLEALLQSGIIGLFLFILISWSLVKMIWQKKRAELSFVTILLMIYSSTESVFESQYSLFIFIFFPIFFYPDNNKSKR